MHIADHYNTSTAIKKLVSLAHTQKTSILASAKDHEHFFGVNERNIWFKLKVLKEPHCELPRTIFQHLVRPTSFQQILGKD